MGSKQWREPLAAAVRKRLLRLRGEADQQEDHDLDEPPSRKPRSDQATSSLDSIFDEIADELASASVGRAAVGHSVQLETYLGEAAISQEDKPLQYWMVNKVRFPTLAKLAGRYLSAPCTSFDSERLFSSVSHIVSESRNRLTADHAEMILFIKKNLPLTFPKKNLVQRPHHYMLTEVWDLVWFKYGYSAIDSSMFCQSESWRQCKIVDGYFVWLKCGNSAIILRKFHRKCLFFIYHHLW